MSNEIEVKIVLENNAEVPVYAKANDSGVDLIAMSDYTIEPHCRVLVKTGVKIAMPPGVEAQIRPRSGKAWKQGLSVVNTPGTIDNGYRNEIGVALLNTSNNVIEVKAGEAIAQMVFCPFYTANFIEVDSLDDTDRGQGGFGSTGR